MTTRVVADTLRRASRKRHRVWALDDIVGILNQSGAAYFQMSVM